jgi:outer membrane protein assembly factor BamB
MVYDGDSMLYVMKGSNTCEVYGLDLRLNVWSDSLDQTSLVGPTNRRVKAGGAMTYHAGRLFVLKGGNTREFWSYDFAADSWRRRTDIPFAFTGRPVKVKRGGALAAAESTLYCLKGSYGYEFWEYKPTGDTASGLFAGQRPGRDGVLAGSDDLALSHAWLRVTPNPTRAGLTLTYNLTGPANTRLRVYDAAGKLVASLAGGPRLRGTHQVRWDGRTTSGRPAAAGVYFAALESGETRLARKLVIER